MLLEIIELYFDASWPTSAISNAVSILLLLFTCLVFVRWLSGPNLNLPKGPTGLPVVGYLPFLGKEPFKTLDKLKEKYGNVFSLRLGQANVIVLADYPAVREAFSKSTTAYRPPGEFDFLPDGLGFGSANGPQWVEGRKFVTKIVKDLGLGRTKWARLVEDELVDLLQNISESNGQPTDIGKLLSPSIANVIVSLIFGKRLSVLDLNHLLAMADSVFQFFSPSGSWIFFRRLCIVLRKLKFSPYYKTFLNMAAFNRFIRDEIQNHRKSQNDVKGIDFISEYLEFLRDAKTGAKETFLNETTMIGDAQVLFIGGSESMRTSLNWLFLLMAEFPEVQSKAYNELESVLIKQEFASWEDRVSFPYCTAVIMEAQRWKPLSPVTTPRMAAEDTKIFDYDVPRGTFIITNIWGIHNDRRYWKEPEKFIPERFLKNGGREVNLKPDSYMPFSFGKRKCPGESIAMMEIFLYFTAVLQRYEVRPPNRVKLNLDGILGFAYFPYPQNLRFIPREQTS